MRNGIVLQLVLLLVLGVSFSADASMIQFDHSSYNVAPGDSIDVLVQFVVPSGTQAAAVSAKVAISGGDVPGEVTTSLAGVTKALTGTYILVDSTGFSNGGTTSLTALGGDATSGADELKTAGTYNFMKITWHASSNAYGDYLLSFQDVGSGVAGSTYLSNGSGIDSITSGAQAIIHVPEPASLSLLAISLLCYPRSRRR